MTKPEIATKKTQVITKFKDCYQAFLLWVGILNRVEFGVCIKDFQAG